jgi:hypothetical protein
MNNFSSHAYKYVPEKYCVGDVLKEVTRVLADVDSIVADLKKKVVESGAFIQRMNR